MKFLIITSLLSFMALANWSEKETVKCILLDENMEMTSQSITIVNEYNVIGLREFSNDSSKFYRDIGPQGFSQSIDIQGQGLKNLLAQEGVENSSGKKGGIIGLTTNGTPYSAGIGLNLNSEGNVSLTGKLSIEPNANYEKHELAWYENFYTQERQNSLAYDFYDNQGISNLRIYKNDQNLDVKFHCYLDLNNTVIKRSEWERVGARIPEVGYGERPASPVAGVNNQEIQKEIIDSPIENSNSNNGSSTSANRN